MNFDGPVVADEPKFAEAIHKEVDARAGGANLFPPALPGLFWGPRFPDAFLAKLGEQQKDPGQPFFTGIEKLIHQVFLHPGITGEQVGNENIGEGVFLVESTHHLFSVDPEESAWRDCPSTCHANRLR